MSMDNVSRRLDREWLLTNGRGGFASGTAVGVPTRRYHGLLVASARPPLERWMLLAALLERVSTGGQVWETPGFQFDGVFYPRGFENQSDFLVSHRAPVAWVRFVYDFKDVRLAKTVYMARGRSEVAIAYRLEGAEGASLSLDVCPFVAMRDFHGLARAFEGGFPIEQTADAVVVSARGGAVRLWLQAEPGEGTGRVVFERSPDWWYGFHYRREADRGQDCREDLFVPGKFRTSGTGSVTMVLHAAADFEGRRPEAIRASSIVVPVDCRPARERAVEDRLREAADAFVVRRRHADGSESTTVLAGYPWFGDWGRDTFIALGGLLLETDRFTEAREVLATFGSVQQHGLIPNRFSDYGDGCDYNSVDASLWYIYAADAYVRASGDSRAWDELLGPVCERIVEAFMAGTIFNIHTDADALVVCGDASTQLTWMDAKFGDRAFTPRHGKPVEINALWYHALCVLVEHSAGRDSGGAGRYQELADRVRQSFAETFWNDSAQCLYDVVRDDCRDAAVRPNQIFAVSLPHSPLDVDQQRAVLACVRRELLTGYGLRSLSPKDPAYCGRYGGGSFERDRAYHQGTVWGWLIGPFVEAYLRVHDFSPDALAEMRAHLSSLIAHLDTAGIGSVSEVFDGDPPHTPGGCIAQAWSVAELLRAWRMVRQESRTLQITDCQAARG